MAKQLLAALILLGATSCAVPQAVKDASPMWYPPKAADPAKEQAQNERTEAAVGIFHACVDKALPGLDDGVSDAKTIALAATNQCASDYRNALQTIGDTLANDAQREIFYRDTSTPEYKQEFTVGEVLRYRASKHQ